jgi:hypothetical protein
VSWLPEGFSVLHIVVHSAEARVAHARLGNEVDQQQSVLGSGPFDGRNEYPDVSCPLVCAVKELC